MFYILWCHVNVLICFYSLQQAVFRAHLSASVAFDPPSNYCDAQISSVYRKVTATSLHNCSSGGCKVQLCVHVSHYGSPFFCHLQRGLVTYIAADISSVFLLCILLGREAFMCPVKTVCRELTHGTGGSVASCWPHTEACTTTSTH